MKIGITDLRQAFSAHRFLFLASAGYILAVIAQSIFLNVPFSDFTVVSKGFAAAALSYILYFLFLLPFFAVWAAVRVKRFSIPAIYNEYVVLYAAYSNSKLPSYSIAGFLSLAALNFFFVQKSLIRFIAPYQQAGWDPVFAKIDKLLFFGKYPHEVIIPLINTLHLARVLDYAYVAWFVLMLAVPAYAILLDNNLQRRMRFLWSYFLYWVILGSVLAVAFSSVGPVFYTHVYPDLPAIYNGIHENLATLNTTKPFLIMIGVDKLIEWTDGTKMINENAISAMPSMHIAMCLLIALYLRSIKKLLLWPGLVFLGLVFLGSIYFGFHYAIDAYLSVIIGLLIWWGTGRLVQVLHPKPEKLIEWPN